MQSGLDAANLCLWRRKRGTIPLQELFLLKLNVEEVELRIPSLLIKSKVLRLYMSPLTHTVDHQMYHLHYISEKEKTAEMIMARYFWSLEFLNFLLDGRVLLVLFIHINNISWLKYAKTSLYLESESPMFMFSRQHHPLCHQAYWSGRTS